MLQEEQESCWQVPRPRSGSGELPRWIHEWKAENWDPVDLAGLFKNMGAKYVVSLANHHDNFDLWDSPYQEWNSVRLGPSTKAPMCVLPLVCRKAVSQASLNHKRAGSS